MPAEGTSAPPQPEARPPRARAPQGRVVPRLLRVYREEVVPTLMREFGYSNPLAVHRVTKVVLNIGLGEAVTNPKAVESAVRDLSLISGQKPVVTRAKKAIASFKVRRGQPIGVMCTLRGDRMYFFLEKLFYAALPRLRDFRGTPRNAFDGRGNYSLGIAEQIIFPEIEYGQIDRLRGLQVNICTTARSDREGMRLLELLGLPFARERAPAGA
ncbi:50S ribosomal protein L5 [bacterium HR23]|nr:50S ribosomal protein L5 [bacterium HR23]